MRILVELGTLGVAEVAQAGTDDPTLAVPGPYGVRPVSIPPECMGQLADACASAARSAKSARRESAEDRLFSAMDELASVIARKGNM